MKILTLAASSFVLASAAFAQPTASDISFQSIEERVEKDIESAREALDDGQFSEAAQLLRTAGANANRLSLQSLTQKLATDAPSFRPEDANFVLARSSTVAFDGLFSGRDTVERRFKDDQGRIVTVRVFGEPRDFSDFMFIKDDVAMLEKGKLEVAEMRGEPAIKRRGEDGELSVLMMSGEDKAIVEVEGDDADAVMAFIGDLENNDQ
ncbi:MAG: hypothetical protein AAFW81_10405 [Pseudomonadota bacterium]